MECIFLQLKCCHHSMVTVAYLLFASLFTLKCGDGAVGTAHRSSFSSVPVESILIPSGSHIYQQEQICTSTIQNALTPWECNLENYYASMSIRIAFSKGRLWSQLIDCPCACLMSFISKIYWLCYATPLITTFLGSIISDSHPHGTITSPPFLFWSAVTVVTCAA